jgi:spore coat protein U-like protein
VLLFGTVLPVAADTGSMAVSAVVLSRSVCRFSTPARTLNFGTIDPTSASAAAASTTLQFWCVGGAGTTYSVQTGNGQHSPGAGLRRLKHGSAAEYMAYTLSLTPASGSLPWFATQTINVAGAIAPVEFQNGRAGTYSDRVVIDLDP